MTEILAKTVKTSELLLTFPTEEQKNDCKHTGREAGSVSGAPAAGAGPRTGELLTLACLATCFHCVHLLSW